ncbi:Uncharacterized protein Rs2_09280 [Raphanus sativus]|nr:Uncharacterized protein Rs2_09280 [Raphanus sativus]
MAEFQHDEVADSEDEAIREGFDQDDIMQQENSGQETNMQQDLLGEDGGDEEIAAESEDVEPELVETVGEEEFVYEDLELRIENIRTQHQAKLAASSGIRTMKRRPFSATFYTAAASARYEHLTSRTVLIQRFLPEVDSDLLEARKIIEKAQLMYTPWLTENLNDATNTITGGKKKKWGNLSMLDVIPTMNILFKFCVYNWMPTANRSTLTIERLKFIHMMVSGRPFDFGVMVFDQIYDLGQQAITGESNKLMFPNLIQHVLDAQFPIPARDEDSAPQKPFKMVLDKKQGVAKNPPGTGPSRRYSYTADVGRVNRLVDRIAYRAARGAYGDLPPSLGDDGEEDGAAEASSQSDEF